MPSRKGPRSAHVTRNVYSQLLGLDDAAFDDFIDKFNAGGHGQVSSGSASLPDPVAKKAGAEARTRQNELDVLENWVVFSHSVENVPAVVNLKTLKGRFIARSFSTGWAAGVVWSVAGQFAVKYKSETYHWAQKLVLGTCCSGKSVNTFEKQ